MNSDDFEKRLQDQTFRDIPTEWRRDILRAAQAAAPAPVSKRVSLWDQLNSLLWPHPKAWAALAGVWMLIGLLHFVTGNDLRLAATASKPPSAELVIALREQQRLRAELTGTEFVPPLNRPPNNAPRSHTESSEKFQIV